jgi:phage shock protein A
MEQNPADLGGMDLPAAKEYVLGFISTLKLTEKQAQDLEAELRKWRSRLELAISRGRPDLAAEAEKEAERIKDRQRQLAEETDVLRSQIAEMRRQLPLLAAGERSVDPDLLEQELLIAAGRLPGEAEKARSDRLLGEMETDAAAEAALAELKAKMAGAR